MRLMETVVTRERIGPDEAREMLETVGTNRKVVQRHVERLAAAIRAGNWIEEAGDPIRFSRDGQLIDGQHRLWAVVESGETLSFVVIRGLPLEVIDVLDSGRNRTLADVLHLHGEKNANVLAGTLNLLHYYFQSKELARLSWNISSITAKNAFEILAEHPGIRNSVSSTEALSKRLRGGPARWAALHYILTSVDYGDAVTFFAVLHDGAPTAHEYIIGLLRNRLIADALSLRKLPVREYTALVFKAWNAYRSGDRVKVLSWKAGGANPEIYPIPA